MTTRSKCWFGIVLVVFGAAAGGCSAAPLLVKKALTDAATAHALTIACIRGKIGFQGIWFDEVTVATKEPQRMRAKFGPLCIRWKSIFGNRSVEVFGGTVHLEGSPEEIKATLAPEPKEKPGRVYNSKRTYEIAVHNVNVSWREGDDDKPKCEISGLDIYRGFDDAWTNLRVPLARCSAGLLAVEVKEASLVKGDFRKTGGTVIEKYEDQTALERPWVLSANAIGVEIVTKPSDGQNANQSSERAPSRDISKSNRPEGSVSQSARSNLDDKRNRSVKTTVSEEKRNKPLPVNGLQTASRTPTEAPVPYWENERTKVVDILKGTKLSSIVEKIPKNSSINTPTVTLRLSNGEQRVAFGPWSFRVERTEDEITAVLNQQKAEDVFKARFSFLPKSQQSEVAVEIGPTTLKRLGVNNDEFGIENVENTNVQLAINGKTNAGASEVTLESKGQFSNLSFRQPWLAKNKVHVSGIEWDGKVSVNLDNGLIHTDGIRLSAGRVSAKLRGNVGVYGRSVQIDGTFEVPIAACQDLFVAMPRGFAPLLENWKVDGTFGLTTSLKYDSRTPESSAVNLLVDNRCRIRVVPSDAEPRRFTRPFVLEVADENDVLQPVTFGPGTWTWTPLSEIPSYVESAVLVCEDGRFLRHSGFDFEAIRNSIRDNLRTGRFARGGSTVSMQLAKNLYLRRDKTVSRKIQEAALTMLLEQTFTKREILELYLNVIEYGPGIYGIGPAARHYFDTTPDRLTMAQSFFLISLLPRPKANHFASDGNVHSGWLNQLRYLMKIAEKRGHFSQAELDVGLNEQLTFRVPGNSQNVVHARSITQRSMNDDEEDGNQLLLDE